MTTLAVVIPAYNRLPDIMHALNSLRALRAGEVAFHVQDDASPDVNLPICVPREVASTSRNERNLGFAGNCNLGAWEAITQYQPDVLFFVNQDVFGTNEWSRGWDAGLLAAFADDSVGVVAPRLLFPNGSIQSAGGTWDTAAQPTHRCLGWALPNVGDGGTPTDVDWTTGAAYAIRTSLFVRLGGFDEGYVRGYFEDADLSIRVREAGYRIRYQPACTLIHSVGSSGGSPYFRQNALRFKQQYVDTGKVKPGRLQQTVKYW
jgi:GT2 family glycosyltransferase